MRYQQIEEFVTRDEYEGFGYLGHTSRRHASDVALATAATMLRLSDDDVFLWANSKAGRWFLDSHERPTAADCERALVRDLPLLRREFAA